MENSLKINSLEVQMKEVTKKLDGLCKTVDAGFKEVDKSFKDMHTEMSQSYVRKAEYKQDMKNMRERVKKAESLRDWIIRTILGLIIAGLLGTIIVK